MSRVCFPSKEIVTLAKGKRERRPLTPTIPSQVFLLFSPSFIFLSSSLTFPSQTHTLSPQSSTSWSASQPAALVPRAKLGTPLPPLVPFGTPHENCSGTRFTVRDGPLGLSEGNHITILNEMEDLKELTFTNESQGRFSARLDKQSYQQYQQSS